MTTLFIIVKNCKQPRCSSMNKCLNTLLYPYHEILASNYKELHWVKCINRKWLYNIWLHLCNMLEITKCYQWKTLEADKERVDVMIKGWHEGPLWWWNHLYLVSINASNLALILCYSFIKYYPWRKLGHEYMWSFCIMSYDSMWIQNNPK